MTIVSIEQYIEKVETPAMWRVALAKIIAVLTRESRYFPEVEWSYLWTHNAFRAFEYCFGRKFGIRAEVSASWENGQVTYAFHTIEARLAHIEGIVRSLIPKRWPVRIHVPMLATPFGPVSASPFLFAVAYQTSGHQTSASSSPTISLTLSGSDLTLVAFPHAAGSGDTITDCQWNGSSITNSTQKIQGNATNWLYGYYKINPTTGTHNLVATCSASDARLVASVYSGTSQSAIDGSGTGSQANSTSYSPTFTVTASNSWSIWGIENNTGDANAATTGTVRQSAGTGRSLVDFGPQSGSGGPTGVTGSGFGSTNDWWHVVISLAPSATDTTVSASVLSNVFAIQSPTASGGATISPAVKATTLATQAPTVSGGATISPSAKAATFAIQAPSISGLANIAASVLSASFSTVAASAYTSYTALANLLTATFTLLDPDAVGGSVTVSPSVLTATFAVQAANAYAPDVQVSVSALAATIALSDPTVSGDATVSPSVIAESLSLQGASISAAALVSPTVLAATFAMPGSNVALLMQIDVSALVAVISAQDPSVYIEQNALVEANVLGLTFSIPTGIFAGGLWTRVGRADTGEDWTRVPRT